VVDWPTIIVVPTEEVTVTVTVFTAPLPPQPAARHAAAITPATHFRIFANFILLPPKRTRIAGKCARSVLSSPTSSKLLVAGIKTFG
jgi:hypothetical protein